MSLPSIEPIRDEDLNEFCVFLNANLSQRHTTENWAKAFMHDWGIQKPNNGFLLRDDGRIVGGIGAIYSRHTVHDKPESFCNITSWCVLDEHRSQSMRLAMALTEQPGFHFSDLTPTEVVSRTLQFLKFRPMNEAQAVWPNLLWPFSAISGVRVITDPGALGQALSPVDAQAYRDHADIPWLNHLAIGRAGNFCHVVWKKCRLKGVSGAFVLAASDAGIFLKYRNSLGSHLLSRHGLLFTRIESRLLPARPKPGIELTGYRNKVYRSDTLAECDISNLYTELVALDI